MRGEFVLIHGLQDEVSVETQPDRYCPNGSAYLLPMGQTSRDFFRTLHEVELARDRHKARYDNVLKGLNYWKQRALASGRA